MAEMVQFIKAHTEEINLIDFQKKFGNQDDIHRFLQFGQQVIHMACRYGNFELVKYLISQGCKLDVSDMAGWKPINWAIQNNKLEIVKILIDSHCSNGCNFTKDNWQTIHHACLIGNLEIAKLLIEKGGDIESCYNVCWRPIHIACKYGRVEVVKLLIEKQCDLEAGCEDDWRPIHYACYFGYIEIVTLLFQHQCQIDYETSNNLPSLIDLARNNGNNQELLDLVENWKLIYDTAKAMELQCDSKCDHNQFCRKSFFLQKFKKGQFLGNGSFGSVYLCEQSNSDRKFALKKIFMDKKDKKFQKYVEHNINIYREKISHPRIIQYFGVYVKHQYLCCFMEFAAGGSLTIKIQAHISHGNIIRYTKEILEGVEFLHEQKIIHRDIKPSNILLDINDNIKLCDFGLSRSLEDPTHEKSTLDASTSCGTHVYLAPEILMNKKYKYSGDIWSIGATVIEMVSGKSPYSEKPSAMAVSEIIKTKKIVFKPLMEMSKELENLIEVMLNPNSDKRATAKELLSFQIFVMEK